MNDERDGSTRFVGAMVAAMVALSGAGYLAHDWGHLKTALPHGFVTQIDNWTAYLGHGPGADGPVAARDQVAAIASQLQSWAAGFSRHDPMATATDSGVPPVPVQFEGWLASFSRAVPAAPPPADGQAAAAARQFGGWMSALTSPLSAAADQQATAVSRQFDTWTGKLQRQDFVPIPMTRVAQLPEAAAGQIQAWVSGLAHPDPYASAEGPQGGQFASLARQLTIWMIDLTATDDPVETQVAETLPATQAAAPATASAETEAASSTSTAGASTGASTGAATASSSSGTGKESGSTLASAEPGSQPKPEEQASLTTSEPVQTEAPDLQSAQEPSFDMVQVDGTGGAVIAGQAAAGSTVMVEANGKSLGETKADAAGDWTLITEQHMAPGDYKLAVTAKPAAGGKTIEGAAFRVTVADSETAVAQAAAHARDVTETVQEWEKQVAQVSSSRLATPPDEVADAVEPDATSEQPSGIDAGKTQLAESGQAAASAPAEPTLQPPPESQASGNGVTETSVPAGTAASSSAAAAVATGTPEPTQKLPDASDAAAKPDQSGSATAQPPPSKGLIDQAGEMANSVSDAVTDILKNLTGSGESSGKTADTSGAEAAKGEVYVSTLSLTGPGGGSHGVVLTGRGKPGSKLSLSVDGIAIGQTTVDADGRWMFEGPLIIDDGKHAARAESLAEDGQVTAHAGYAFEAASTATQGATPTVVALNPPIIVPSAEQPKPEEKEQVAFSSATYKPTGEKSGLLTVSGRGVPGGRVDLSVDKEPIAKTPVDTNGRWLTDIDHWFAPGRHQITAELADSKGEFLSRVIRNLEFEAPVVVASTQTGAGGTDSSASASTAEPSSGTTTETAAGADAAASQTIQADTAILSEDNSRSKPAARSAKQKLQKVAQRRHVRRTQLAEARKPHRKHGRIATASRTRLVRVVRGSDVTEERVRKSRRGRIIGFISQMIPMRYELGRSWYKVRKGDTLWSIASKHYGKPQCYTLIWKANRSRLRSPNRIYPGQRLVI